MKRRASPNWRIDACYTSQKPRKSMPVQLVGFSYGPCILLAIPSFCSYEPQTPYLLRSVNGRNLANLVATILREPEVAIRADRDTKGLATSGGKGIFGEDAPGGNLANLVPIDLSEPEIAIRACRDIFRPAICVMRNEMFGQRAPGGNLANLVRINLGEPEVAIRACRDVNRSTLIARERIFGDDRFQTRVASPDLRARGISSNLRGAEGWPSNNKEEKE